MSWRPITQLAVAKMPNITVTVTKMAAMRPIQRSKRVTTRESRNVTSVASAIGTNNALERAEARAELRELMLGQGLPAKHQHWLIRPQRPKLIDGFIVELLPEAHPDDLASEAVVQRPGL